MTDISKVLTFNTSTLTNEIILNLKQECRINNEQYVYADAVEAVWLVITRLVELTIYLTSMESCKVDINPCGVLSESGIFEDFFETLDISHYYHRRGEELILEVFYKNTGLATYITKLNTLLDEAGAWSLWRVVYSKNVIHVIYCGDYRIEQWSALMLHEGMYYEELYCAATHACDIKKEELSITFDYTSSNH